MIKYAGDLYRCGDDEGSLRAAQAPAVRREGHQPHESAQTPQPRIDHGRWIVDCQCGSGAGVSRQGKAFCFECGAIMRVLLPSVDQRNAAEALLTLRKESNQNWHPDHETVDDLRAENAVNLG